MVYICFQRQNLGCIQIISVFNIVYVCVFVCIPNRQVDNEILNILRQRQEDCIIYEKNDHRTKCAHIMEEYNKAAENWFIKCKDDKMLLVCVWGGTFGGEGRTWGKVNCGNLEVLMRHHIFINFFHELSETWQFLEHSL